MLHRIPGWTSIQDTPLPFQSLDREGRIQEVNAAWTSALGYSREEVLGSWFGDFQGEEDRKGFPERLAAFFEAGHMEGVEVNLRTRSGESILVQFFGHIVREEGKEPRTACLFQDITEIRETHRALEERNTFIGTILDNLPIGLAVNFVDEGTATYMNRRFTEIYGWPEGELTDIANFFRKVYPDPAYRKEVMDRVMDDLASGDPDRMFWENMRITRNDGSRAWVTAMNIPIPEQNFMISTVWDVTELHDAQRDLEATIQRLRELAAHVESVREEERQAISRELHDTLGQALTAIGLDLSALRGKIDPAPGTELAEDFEALQALVSQTLVSTQDMSGALRPNALEALGLAAAVEDYLAITTNRTGLACEVESEIPDDLFGEDESLILYRLVQEAVTNTVRHAEASTVRVVFHRPAAGEVLVEVADDGRGITREESHDPRSLGLLGMRERLLALGGTLEIRGRPEEGTVLRMRVPAPDGPES